MFRHREQIYPCHAFHNISLARQILQVAGKSIGAARDIDDAARCKAGEAA